MRAKKQLGQHFLIDKSVILRIISNISDHCSSEIPLLEVGPGQGAITLDLLKEYPEFKAVELDKDMIEILRLHLKPDQLINMDILRLDMQELFDGREFNLVGNFPYNISSQIIFKIIENRHKIPVMIGMFQKELAERICSSPGGKSNGILSLNAQAYYHAEILFNIGPEAFDPPPKVESSVIILKRKDDFQLGCDENLYRTVVKQAFSQRRKKMRNTLKSFDLDLESDIFQKRPEQLGVDEFVNIVNSIKTKNT